MAQAAHSRGGAGRSSNNVSTGPVPAVFGLTAPPPANSFPPETNMCMESGEIPEQFALL